MLRRSTGRLDLLRFNLPTESAANDALVECADDVAFPTDDPQPRFSQSTLSEVAPLMVDLLVVVADE